MTKNLYIHHVPNLEMTNRPVLSVYNRTLQMVGKQSLKLKFNLLKSSNLVSLEIRHFKIYSGNCLLIWTLNSNSNFEIKPIDSPPLI